MNLFEPSKKDKNKETSISTFIQKLINSKQFKNSILIIFLIIFVGGYAVFFTSSLYLPTDTSDYRVTELNSFNELDSEHKFSIARWQYSEEQQRMEVELDIENTAYDGMTDYRVQVRTDPSSRTTVNKIINESTLLILQIDNVPNNFKIISLQIALPNDNENILRLYTNPEAVERVDALDILTRTEYQINRLERNILNYQNEIESFKNEISEKQNKIANIEAQNQELYESRQFRTEAEIQEIDQQIQTNKALIETETKAIDELNSQILENENRIKLTQEQIAQIK